MDIANLQIARKWVYLKPIQKLNHFDLLVCLKLTKSDSIVLEKWAFDFSIDLFFRPDSQRGNRTKISRTKSSTFLQIILILKNSNTPVRRTIKNPTKLKIFQNQINYTF